MTTESHPRPERSFRMPNRDRAWLWYLLAGTVVAVAYIVLPQNQVTNWIFPVVNSTGGIAAFIGLRRNRPRNRSAWAMLATALSLSAIGDIIFAGYDLFHAEAP